MNRKAQEVFLSGAKTPYIITAVILFMILVIGVKVGIANISGNYYDVEPQMEYDVYRTRVLGCFMAPPPGGVKPALGIVDRTIFDQTSDQRKVELLTPCLQQPKEYFRIILIDLMTNEQSVINYHDPDANPGVPKNQRSTFVLIKDGTTYTPGELIIGVS